MQLPRDCLIIRIDICVRETVGTYKISRQTEGKTIPLSNKSGEVYYEHIHSSFEDLNLVKFFIQALNKGLVWQIFPRQEQISISKFSWAIFLSSYGTFFDVPELKQLSEEFEKFTLDENKIEQCLLAGDRLSNFQIVINLNSLDSTRLKLLETLKQNNRVIADIIEPDYQQKLELFQQFETQLFDVLKSL